MKFFLTFRFTFKRVRLLHTTYFLLEYISLERKKNLATDAELLILAIKVAKDYLINKVYFRSSVTATFADSAAICTETHSSPSVYSPPAKYTLLATDLPRAFTARQSA